jgi:hypothetical protein
MPFDSGLPQPLGCSTTGLLSAPVKPLSPLVTRGAALTTGHAAQNTLPFDNKPAATRSFARTGIGITSFF